MAGDRRGPRRSLLGGLAISAVGIWLTIQARLGVAPWEVLHIGLASRLGVGVGTASILVGAVLVVTVALAGIRPGIGTVLNVLTIGAMLNLLLALPLLDDVADAAPCGGSTVLSWGSWCSPSAARSTWGHISALGRATG